MGQILLTPLKNSGKMTADFKGAKIQVSQPSQMKHIAMFWTFLMPLQGFIRFFGSVSLYGIFGEKSLNAAI